VPKGFVAVKDSQDGYAFLYPFGWQEVSVDGQVRRRRPAITNCSQPLLCSQP